MRSVFGHLSSADERKRGELQAALRRRLALYSTVRHSHQAIFTVEYSPDGRVAAGCGQDKLLLLLDGVTGKSIARVDRAHHGCVNVARFVNSYYMVTGGDDSLVRVWDIRRLSDSRGNAANVRVFKGHQDWIKNVEPVGRTGLLLSSAFDRSIRCWDISQFSSMPSETLRPFETIRTLPHEMMPTPRSASPALVKCSLLTPFDAAHSHFLPPSPTRLPLFSPPIDNESNVYITGIASDEVLSQHRFMLPVPVMRLSVAPTGDRLAFCTFRPFIFIIHNLDVVHLARDLAGISFDELAESTQPCRHRKCYVSTCECRHFVFHRKRNTLEIIDSPGLRCLFLQFDRSGTRLLTQPAYSHGQRISVYHLGDRASLIATAPVHPCAVDFLRGPCFSSDGNFVYFPERSTVRVMKLASRDPVDASRFASTLSTAGQETDGGSGIVLSCAASPIAPLLMTGSVTGHVSVFHPLI